MQTERKKILEMIAEGKISADDAEKLLDKIAGTTPNAGDASAAKREASPLPQGVGRKFLRILISGASGRDEVNLRIPLTFMRSGIKLLTVLPPQVTQKLAAKGIDLSGFLDSSSQLTESMEELDLNMDSGEGQRLRVYCE